MINRHLEGVFRDLSTPLVADACVRIGLALRLAPPGLAGIIVWGCHRDTAEVVSVGLPVFSCGASR